MVPWVWSRGNVTCELYMQCSVYYVLLPNWRVGHTWAVQPSGVGYGKSSKFQGSF